MRVVDIVLPLSRELLPHPSVELGDPITRAIELMVSHNLQEIVVMSNGSPIGMVRRKDAFHKIGLRREVQARCSS